MKSGPHLPQLEKALAQKRRPNTAKNKFIKKKKHKTGAKGQGSQSPCHIQQLARDPSQEGNISIIAQRLSKSGFVTKIP